MKEKIVKKIEELEKEVEELDTLYRKLAHDITTREETFVWLDAEIETTQKFIDFLIELIREWYYDRQNKIQNWTVRT